MDDRLSLIFARLRRAITQDLPELEDLFALERSITEVFSDLDGQARAVADANAQAVEINERLSDLAEELKAQNQELRQQKPGDPGGVSLRLQSQAIAEATVDAVLEVEASHERVSQLERKRTELEGARTTSWNEKRESWRRRKTCALAAANVEAVALVLKRRVHWSRWFAPLFIGRRRSGTPLKDKVFVDELTGLFNHRYFREQIKNS